MVSTQYSSSFTSDTSAHSMVQTDTAKDEGNFGDASINISQRERGKSVISTDLHAKQSMRRYCYLKLLNQLFLIELAEKLAEYEKSKAERDSLAKEVEQKQTVLK
jgi:hypothetical protein